MNFITEFQVQFLMTRERITNINSSPYFYPCTLQLEITDCFACFACIFIELASQSES